MNIWKDKRWKAHISPATGARRSGLRLRLEKGVDPCVRRACIKFAAWLRKEYDFPVRIPVYVKSAERIRARDGDMVCGTFFRPDSMAVEPYARIATGDFGELRTLWGEEEAMGSILSTMAHELSHYFQWLNQIEQSEIDEEKQAERCTRAVMRRYAASVDSFFEDGRI